MVGVDGTLYVAVIGDIRASRRVKDRQAVQTGFREAVASLEGAIADGSTASPATITTGDEFQVLYEADAVAAVDAIVHVTEAMAPTRLRFGLGLGSLETELNEEAAIGMDGPCFHAARDAIDAAKRAGGWVRVAGFGDALDRSAGDLFDVVAAIREDWTDRQTEFARAFRELGLQKDVAARFEVSPSVVSESLKRAHVHRIMAAETSLARLLQHRLAEIDREGASA